MPDTHNKLQLPTGITIIISNMNSHKFNVLLTSFFTDFIKWLA